MADAVFPQRIAVRANAKDELAFYDAGKRVAGPAGIEWEIGAGILALFGVAGGTPEAMAERYFAVTSAVRPDAGWLQAAVQALPTGAREERAFLAHAVARAAEMSLGDAPGKLPVPEAEIPGPFHGDGWRQLSPAALLDACFEALEAGGYDRRSGQLEMAHAVLETFLGGGPLLVEAGTGTGKTLAYALPAIVVAAQRGSRVLLSTHTRNLQQQLCDRDLPGLWRRLGIDSLPQDQAPRFVKLLGRDNYVCDTALSRWVSQGAERGGSLAATQLVLARLRAHDGVLEEVLGLDAPPLAAAWREVAARRETCVGRACRSCPVHRARDNARNANLVVINHALLFADARSESVVLGDWDVLVVDEAHHLDKVATHAFGLRLGWAHAEALGRPVLRLQSELRGLAKLPPADSWRPRLETWCERERELQEQLARWLADLDAALPERGRERPRQRYRDGDEAFGGVRDEAMSLVQQMQHINEESQRWLGELRAEAEAEPCLSEATTLFELAFTLHFETAVALEFLVRGNDDDWAFYLDFSAPERRLREIVGLPLEVADEIHAFVAGSGGVVFTSATLCVESPDGSHDAASWFRGRIGLDRCRVMRIPSPFDYLSQCRLVRTSVLGSHSDPDFLPQAAELIVALSRRTGRRMLVLLTAHRALARLAAELESHPITLLAQGLDGGRAELAERFVSAPGAVLLGVDSFWEGVDFPGEALELLVIVKLPFAVPGEPLVAARSDRLRAAGENPFEAFVLPEALLRFRQGFGRLIRSQDDRGAVLFLDPRLETREYGERFLAALPAAVEAFEDTGQLVDAVATWFALLESTE